MPVVPPKSKAVDQLSRPQQRVLEALFNANGPLTRTVLSAICGNKTQVMVGRAVGYSDPIKRAAFEQTKDGGGSPGNPCPSLLTLGYVEEIALDIDGLIEVAVKLTASGRLIAQQIVDQGPVPASPRLGKVNVINNPKRRS